MNSLHNFAKFSEQRTAQVLLCGSVVEAEAAQKRLNGKVIATTWIDDMDHADWSSLQGRSVGLLTDNTIEDALVAAISPFALAIKVIDRPADAAIGWTLADAPEDFQLKDHARVVYTAPKLAAPDEVGNLKADEVSKKGTPAPAVARPASAPRQGDIDFTGLMEPVARRLLGEPNAKLSKATELRYGTNGSLSVDLEKNNWCDHESGEGGGVLGLIVRESAAPDPAQAMVWLREKGFAPRVSGPASARQPDDAARKLAKVREDFRNGDDATPDHDYIVRKQGKPDGLRTVSWLMHGWAAFKGKSLLGWLMVAVYGGVGNTGDVISVQYIGPSKGEKLNAPVPIKGGSFTVGELKRGKKAYIVEGIGHAWSLNAVTGSPAVVTFGAGNMEVIAAAVQAAGAMAVIVPDRGKEEDASGIAARLDCWSAPLPADLENGADVNDLHLERGDDAVRAVVDAASAPTRMPAMVPIEQPEWHEHGDAFDFLDVPQGPPAKPPLPPFAFTRVGDMLDHLKPIDWLIKRYLEADSLALLFSDPGVGKSFMVIDLACCIAMGRPWHGNESTKGAVFLIAGEGHNGLARRFKAWEIANGVDLQDAPLYVSHKAAAFCDGDSAEAVIKAVRALANETGAQPRLIVIDTVARNFGPGDENSTKEMGEFIQNLDELKHEFKATVLLVHHSGHADKGRARGSMALKGALDAEYRLERDDEAKLIRFEATKMKDAEFPESLSFKLEGVKLPLVDDDGNNVFGAAIRSTMHVPKAKPGKAGNGKHQLMGLEVLKTLEVEHRARVEDSGRSGGEARVKERDWRERLERESGGAIDRRRYPEVKKGLIAAGSVTCDSGGYVQTT
ncbi:AAA domain-containing protein [Variovorax sp. OK605]|uniref:AAA family ATPase n=1 Tax=Variovorax sp. OK605 TaxID=1855317 RepID=UPI0008F1BA4A|nr:helicase RepA family protein [Variovorax sp. OK605]SFO84771.1 AAA domain-containing protein [Variovorax sp. OK605]